MSSRGWTMVAYDVGHVIDLLMTEPFSLPLSAGGIVERHAKRNLLIDQFFAHTINSFEHCFVMGYDSSLNTVNELTWFSYHEQARRYLWSILKLTHECAGMNVHMIRRDRTLYISYPSVEKRN